MAEQTIDRVQVEIEATGKNIDNVFKNLESYLTRIETALSKIDVSKLEKVNSTLSKVNKTVSTTSNSSITPKFDTSQIEKEASKISSKITDIKASISGLQPLIDAAMSGDTSSLTSFQRRVISINSSIAEWQSKLESVGNMQIPSSQWTDLQTRINDANTNLGNLKAEEEEYISTHPNYAKESDYQNIVAAIQTAETEVQALKEEEQELIANGGASSNFSSSSVYEGLKTQFEDLKTEVNSTKDTVTSACNEMNKQTITINTDDVISAFKNVGTSATEAAQKLWQLAKTGISSGINGVKLAVTGLKSRITSLSSSVSKVNSGFSKGFTTILKYGFGIRSLYVLFRRLRTAVTDSFTELQTSGAFFATTNANVDALSNSLTTLKYQFGAAFEPIFNTVAPALQTLINYLVAVMNTISAFIAKLTGASTYSKAVVATAEIADNTGSAAGSAEDLNKQLQGFDELNNLSGDSDSGGGSGGSSSSDDSTVTYVEESVDSALTTFWDSLADAISSGDWYLVGSMISDELTSALNSIPWSSVFSTMQNFGTDLASFLNGLITDDLFSALGSTIANAIKSALYAKLYFAEEFEWSGLGTAIASGINSFVDTQVLQLSVITFNKWATGILDTLIAAIQNISWSGIATTIADCIGKFDASGIMGRLGTVASSIANALYTLVSNKNTWTNLGTKISEGINSFFSSMSTVDSSTGKTGWNALGSTITSSLTGFGDMLITALNNTDWVAVGQGIADFISGIDWSQIKFTFGNLLTALKSAILGILLGMSITPHDLVNATLTITGLYVTLTGLNIVASITKQAIMTAITNQITSIIGENGLSMTVGSVGKVIGSAAAVITVAIVGWKIGGKLYEDATGQKAPDLGETLSTLFSEGAFSDLISGIKLDLQSDASITLDLAGTLASVTGVPNVASMSATVNRMNATVKKIVVDVDTSKTDTVMTFTNQLSLDSLLGEDFQKSLNEKGEEIVDGVVVSAEEKASKTETFAPMVNYMHDSVDTAIEDEFEINSPAKTMYKYGESIVEGVRDGIGKKSLSETFSGVISGLKSTIDTVMGTNGLSTYNVTVTATQGTPDSSLKSMGTSFSDKIKKKWTDTHANVDADLGGDLEDNGINTFSTWETIFSNFKSIWTGTSATFKAKTGGDISNINDLTSWQGLISGLTGAWTSKSATFTASYGSNTSANIIDNMKKKIGELTDAWFGKSASFSAGYANGTTPNSIGSMKDTIDKLTGAWFGETAIFGASYASNTSVKTIDDMKSKISELTGAWFGQSASFSASFNQTTETMGAYAQAIKDIHDSWTGANASFTISADTDDVSLTNVANTIVSKIKSKLSGQIAFTAKAMGGVLTNGGWKSIPQYASGSLNTGSLFFAGEKSGNPELVGHVNGRTEVLNKSQLASVMYASVGQALRNFGSLASPPTLTANGYSANGVTGGAGRSNSDALLMEQNRLLERQNMLLEQIANKDNTISVNDIFGAMQSANNDYFNRTGNSAFAF